MSLTLSTLTAWDTETHLIEPGLLAPPLVCATEADVHAPPRIYLREGLGTADALARFRLLLESGRHVVGANLAYDLGVHAAADPGCLPLIVAALDEGRLHDVSLLEALHDNARGLLYREANGTPIRYSLALLEARYLGHDRSEEKQSENAWRLRYHELDGVPLAKWPQEAVDYPLRDAQGTLDVAAIQLGLRAHEGGPRQNLQCEADEMRAAFALHLVSCYGMRTDPEMVRHVVGDMRAAHDASRRKFFAAGLVKVGPCGKDQTPDVIDAAWLHNALAVFQDSVEEAGGDGLAWRAERQAEVLKALARLAKGKPIRFSADTQAIAARVTAAYAGSPPTTETGKVSTARDTLVESGDALLEEYGVAGGDEKELSSFAEVIQAGTVTPINARYTVMVASGRTSCSAPNLQQLPRGGHVRECFVPRPGRVLVSVDYSALELCTLAQVTYSWCGVSAMRDAINAGQDLHLRLAARLAGVTYEEAQRRLKDKDPGIKNLRQVSKPVNFGLPGRMGAPKLVLTARKQGVRFCELSGRSARCADNPRVTEYGRRTIAPTCTVCLELARTYSALWRQEWPEMDRYLQVVPELAERGVPLPSMGNGMLRLDLESGAGAYCNHFFQNLAAQGAKRALYRLVREAYADRSSVLYGAWSPVVFVHDEVIAEVEESVLHEAAHRQAEVMVSTMQEVTPDVRIAAAPAAARRWFKSMEAVHDSSGRLRPWWPPDAKREWAWGPDQADMARDLEA